jgi:large subunit ribosomal protein L17
VMAIVQEKDVVHKLFENADKRYGAQNGGYTRIIKIGRRPGDAAPVSLIELVNAEPKAKPKKKAAGEGKKKEAAVDSAPAAEVKSPAPDAEARQAAGEADSDAASAAEPVAAAAASEQEAAPSSEETDQGAEGPEKE